MLRDQVSFEDFKEGFIDKPRGGYYAVYSDVAEDDDTGDLIKTIDIDLICEWRLPDGKVLFLSVSFDTREQFDELVTYLMDSPGHLAEASRGYAATLKFPSQEV